MIPLSLRTVGAGARQVGQGACYCPLAWSADGTRLATFKGSRKPSVGPAAAQDLTPLSSARSYPVPAEVTDAGPGGRG